MELWIVAGAVVAALGAVGWWAGGRVRGCASTVRLRCRTLTLSPSQSGPGSTPAARARGC